MKLPASLLCLLLTAPTLLARPRTPGPKAAQKPHQRHSAVGLASQIDALLKAPEVAHAHWGISVVNTDGAPIYARNDGEYFAPASNAKLFTTAAAFALLGPDFVSRTYIVRQGEVDANGKLSGPLRIIGTGDPSLSGRTYPYNGKTERPDPPLHVLDELAAQVAASGIREIDGPIIGDDSYFPAERYGSGWGWDDLQWSYGAPVSALTVNDNVVYLNIMPGTKLGDPAVISWNPALPDGAGDLGSSHESRAINGAAAPAGLGPSEGTVRDAGGDLYTAANSIVTTSVGATQQIGVDRPPASSVVSLYGTIPLDSNGAHLALAIEDPAAYAASAFKGMLLAHGVKVNGISRAEEASAGETHPYEDSLHDALALHPPTRPPSDRTLDPTLAPTLASTLEQTSNPPPVLRPGEAVVATHTSPVLVQEATVVNKVSQNLHAELLLRQLGKAQTGDGSFVQGARVVRQFLIGAGLLPDDFLFYDGSGLSPKDQVTPRAVTALLTYAARQPWGGFYRSTLPIGGVDGTLALRFAQSPLKGKIFAKTGTLAEAQSLSGYLIAASGKTLAFSILCNGRRPASDAERKAMDTVVELIAGAN